MNDEPSPSLENITTQIRFYLSDEIDFARTDTASTLAKVRLLTAAATYFNTLAVDEFGGRSGAPRAPGLVEQVIATAFQTFAGVDPHPGPFEKAAMLLRGITQGHPFNDGNKRTGFLVAGYYLELVGISYPDRQPQDETVEFCLRVSAGEIRDVLEMARVLRRLWLGPNADAS